MRDSGGMSLGNDGMREGAEIGDLEAAGLIASALLGGAVVPEVGLSVPGDRVPGAGEGPFRGSAECWRLSWGEC